MTTPVYDATTIARLSVDDAVRPLVAAKQADSKAVRFFWRRQSLNIYPCVIHQSQDNGGTGAHFLNIGAWAGLWVIQAFAKDQATADEWLAAVRAGMDALAIPSGYSSLSIQADYEQPLILPPDQDIYPSGAIWRIRITRS
jgi:hypothetical protein